MSTTIKIGVVWLVGFMISFLAPIILFSTLIIPKTVGAMISVFILSAALGSIVAVICGAICLDVIEDK